jgi:hypothetical protein
MDATDTGGFLRRLVVIAAAHTRTHLIRVHVGIVRRWVAFCP